jgi:hypothetical protein
MPSSIRSLSRAVATLIDVQVTADREMAKRLGVEHILHQSDVEVTDQSSTESDPPASVAVRA